MRKPWRLPGMAPRPGKPREPDALMMVWSEEELEEEQATQHAGDRDPRLLVAPAEPQVPRLHQRHRRQRGGVSPSPSRLTRRLPQTALATGWMASPPASWESRPGSGRFSKELRLP